MCTGFYAGAWTNMVIHRSYTCSLYNTSCSVFKFMKEITECMAIYSNVTPVQVSLYSAYNKRLVIAVVCFDGGCENMNVCEPDQVIA